MEQPSSRKWSEKWCCRRLAVAVADGEAGFELPEGVFNLVMGPAVGGRADLGGFHSPLTK
jgi:hypothetical protein